MSIKTVTKFQTSDGEIFETRYEAEDHELELVQIKSLKNLVKEMFGDSSSYGYNAETIFDMLVENKDKIKDIFNTTEID